MARLGNGAGAGSGPGPAPLLAPAARRPAAALTAVCVVVAAVLGGLVAHKTRAGWLDQAVDGRVRSALASQSTLMHWVIQLGTPVPVTVLTVALAAACLVAGNRRGAALTVIAVPAAEVITELVLKPLIARTNGGDGFSFPSGHTTGVFVLAGCFAVLLAGPQWPKISGRLRLVLVLAAFTVASIVAVFLVAVGFHYFTDTIGGAAVATGTVLATAFTLDKLDGKPAWGRRFRGLAPDRLTR